MKKQRTRFDAIADEIADPKPEPPKPKFPPPPIGLPDPVYRRSNNNKPSAVLNVSGTAHQVLSFDMKTESYKVDPIIDEVAARATTAVIAKVEGILRKDDLDTDVTLVVFYAGVIEPDLYRLSVTNIRWTQTGRDRTSCTEITAIVY